MINNDKYNIYIYVYKTCILQSYTAVSIMYIKYVLINV